MQFTTIALAALATLASAQKTTVVTVGMNGTITFTPNNIKVPVGEAVQFQFTAGNHTVTQSTFDQPCSPINAHNANVTGFHSGFQPAAASAAMGMVPTYTITVNNTTPIWIYCGQAKHCQGGMVMVINENTAANASRSLAAFKTLASSVAVNQVPGGSASTGGTTGSTGTNSTGSNGGGNTGTGTNAAGVLAVPLPLSLLGLAAAVFLL
ncbi:Cupredoxin [Thozetella sp. PMI_491]|nr:Cupredoxin [Thozetella sp. PMI_491]